MMARTGKLRERFLGPPRPVESFVRNVLALGFLALLLLVVGVGYRSIQSLEQLEKESRRVDETEELRLRIALRMSETAGKSATEARTVVATRQNRLMETPAAQRLKQLKREMDKEIVDARKSSLVDSQEWQDFEASYASFWEAMEKPGPASDEWLDERNSMLKSVSKLQDLIDLEREQNNLKAHEMSLSARNRIVTATAAVLMVGVVVAVLAFYEIRKNLKRLGGAYAASAESRDYLQSLLDSLVSGSL
jgi:CHASE3 domain sensor protein